MEALLVVFHLPEGSPSAAHRAFRRAVYGEETSSHEGRYRYRRSGVLDRVPHVRLYWGAVIVRSRDWAALRMALEEHGALFETRGVRVTPADLRALSRAIG